MKKLLIFTLTYLLIITSTVAQNNTWSLPPNYFNGLVIQPLPTQPGFNLFGANYHPSNNNTISEHSHAAMQDANGDLLFFVVDGVVYSNEGFYIGEFENPLINMPGGAKGNAEVLIIPKPDNCQQYYIVLTAASGPVINAGQYQNFPIYVLLDLSQSNINNASFKGNLLSLNNIPSTTNTARDLRQGLIPNWSPDPKHKGVFMATSKLRPDNTRFLFITNGIYVYRYLVTSNGITYDSYFGLAGDTGGQNYFRSEMELYEFDNGGVPNYKIAIPYSGTTEESIFIAELNNNGDVITNTTQYIVFPNANNVPAYLKGIEFSPNGNYLYITHNPNFSFPVPFKIVDVNTGNFVNILNNQLLTDIPNFQNSHIELSGESVVGGRMYLANGNNLATIDNVNNPIFPGLLWNSTAQTLNNYNLSTRNISTPVGGLELYILPDQIDGMDYSAYLVDPAVAGIACCIENSPYDIAKDDNNNEFTGTHTWIDGNNTIGTGNLSSPITVKDKMIIKAGANITINNMRFEFAPQAQLIIERGATLIINGTTLTADTRCTPETMWHGVEVWGTTGAYQTALTGGLRNSGQFITDNSVIEHAIVGAANAQHNQTNLNNPIEDSFVTGFSGGIIKSNTTTFRNNKKDVQFTDFFNIINNNTYNDQSRFIECHFVTNAHLNNPSLNPYTHVVMTRVKGISFSACVFETIGIGLTAYPFMFQRGFGIRAYETLFTVSDKCSVAVPFPQTCPPANQIQSEFNNLYYGVLANGGSMPTQTAKISNSTFDNNYRSMYFINLLQAKVTNNTIFVGANISPSARAYGLYLLSCDKYQVEDNNFSTSLGYYGAYINNSGAGANEIYRNTFSNFVVATQAANINGDASATVNATGLEFRCNKYFNTTDYDILVSSGLIKAFHGSCVSNTKPSNNQFSYTAQSGDIWLNSGVTANVSYQYSTGGVNLEPLTYSITPSVNPTVCSNLPAFNYNTSCPKSGGFTPIQLSQLIVANNQIVNDLQADLDGGNQQELLNKIATLPAWQINNQLAAASPYLSDKVLLAVLSVNNNIPNWVIEQTLTANAPLSDKVLLAAINRTIVLPAYLIHNLVNLSSPLSTTEQMALVNHAPQYADWMLEQIMVNESPLQEEVLLALLNKSPYIAGWSISNILKKNTPLTGEVSDAFNNHIPMYPNWIRNGVNNSYFVADAPKEEAQPLSVRMELDLEINYYQQQVERHENGLIRIALFDETKTDQGIKDVIDIIESSSCNTKKCDLTTCHIANNDFVSAQNKVNELAQGNNNADFCKLYNSVIQYQQTSEKEDYLVNHGSVRVPVEELANSTSQNSEIAIAKSILLKVSNEEIQETFEMVTAENSTARIGNNDQEENENKYVPTMSLYPNPTYGQFTIAHNLDTENSKIVLTVYDVLGKVTLQQTLTQNKVLIDAKSLRAGIYFYSIVQNNQTLQTDKLIVE